MTRRAIRTAGVAAVAACAFLPGVAGAAEAALGERLPLVSALPFAGVLLSIALLPLIANRFWHHHYPKLALGWIVLFVVPFVAAYRGPGVHAVMHALLGEYLPFVLLLWALYTIAGGIAVRGALGGTPAKNTALLAAGMLLASAVGTTGASMLLIRPFLRANAHRTSRTHLAVFFLFLISNIGGALTPLGDPPLFLGYLSGVPFFWTLRLAPHMLLAAALLLAAFYVLDRRSVRREAAPAPGTGVASPVASRRFDVAGRLNLVWLVGVVSAVLASGVLHWGEVQVAGVPLRVAGLGRDALLLLFGLLSLRFSPRGIRAENHFTWEPMREVAILFVAIFITIVPALAILDAGDQGGLAAITRAVREPWQYFWVTGTLSAFLDNAPTYLTFFNTALGTFRPQGPDAELVARLIAEAPRTLAAISCGAVFMGACTYIGNAPNFMVRAIAAEDGVRMPSFFGFIGRWTLPFLVPVFLIVTLVFFR